MFWINSLDSTRTSENKYRVMEINIIYIYIYGYLGNLYLLINYQSNLMSTSTCLLYYEDEIECLLHNEDGMK